MLATKQYVVLLSYLQKAIYVINSKQQNSITDRISFWKNAIFSWNILSTWLHRYVTGIQRKQIHDKRKAFLKIIPVLSYQHNKFRCFLFCFVLQSRLLLATSEFRVTYRILKTNISLWPVLLGEVLPSLCYHHAVSSSAKIRKLKSMNWWKSLVLIIKNVLSYIDS